MKSKIHIQWKLDNGTITTCDSFEEQLLKEQIIKNVISNKKEGFKLKYIKRVYTKDLTYYEWGYYINTALNVEQYITLNDLKYKNLSKGARKWAEELLNLEEELKWKQEQLQF